MESMIDTDLPQYPGSRWWKFDFHTHTPASRDTPWFKTNSGLTPEKWLLKYMVAKIDCVAVTDHNSGAWVDLLKASYKAMEELRPEGFRALTLFPGVEISVSGGLHVLAIFDPSKTTSDIDTLLGRVRYAGTKGDSDSVTSKGVADVIREIISSTAIPIPAHADRAKGLLQCQENSNKGQVDAHTVRQAIEVEGLLAIEWCNLQSQWPEAVRKSAPNFAHVLGSDCHSFRGEGAPGSRFTWIKMAHPTIEGLRLALLDGNDVSIRRSDEIFDPLLIPTHSIASIEIEDARYIGNGKVARLELSPYFNAIVGGRGTGKSTAVHALRLATQRSSELEKLGSETEPSARFADFGKVTHGRDGKGALRETTKISVEWRHDNTSYRLHWCKQKTSVEENKNGRWEPSASQNVNSARFPVRILSQGQVAAMAGSGRQSLLSIIDEAADVEQVRQVFEEGKRSFFSQCAKLRELDGKLAGRTEIVRKNDEARKKLAALSLSENAAILGVYASAKAQHHNVSALIDQLRNSAENVEKMVSGIAIAGALQQDFDAEIFSWRTNAEQLVERLRKGLREQAILFRDGISALESDKRLERFRQRTLAADTAHANLQVELKANGVADPGAFARLTGECQNLDAQLSSLSKSQIERDELANLIEVQFSLIIQKRRLITEKRQQFIERALANNEHVRIVVVPFGFDARAIEREFRGLIDAVDERFSDSILTFEVGEPRAGLAFELANSAPENKAEIIEAIKQRLLAVDSTLNGHFANHLQRKHVKPEFADHIRVWFPEDDLKIAYKREGTWCPISQGSQGQRSATLLAFLLAFGETPIVLDQPEDDLDNHLIYDLIVRQVRENKLRRQLIVVTHNANLVVNGDAELVHVMAFGNGQCFVSQSGSFQDEAVRSEVCRVMEGGEIAFARRWKRLGKSV